MGRKKEFTILSVLAMLLVMLGHVNYDLLTFGGLFPYYSYHVLIFVFISGYFYKPESEDKIHLYIWHKFKRLMIPYFIWNFVYGIVVAVLHKGGFAFGGELSIYNFFIAPFVGGHQFMLNAPAWFIPALFMLEICNVLGRRVLSALHIKNEYLIMLLYLLIGIFTVFMAKRGSVYDYYKIPGRLMLMAPCLQLGRLYRDKLEAYDRVPSVIYFALLFAMNYILVKTHGGLAYSVVWVTGFANTVLTPFITALTGIMLWLRVAKLLAAFMQKLPSENIINRLTEFFGAHTFDVCMHQLIAFMGVNAVLAIISVNGFDMELFESDVYYTFTPAGVNIFKLVYVIAGVIISLGIGYVAERVKVVLYSTLPLSMKRIENEN